MWMRRARNPDEGGDDYDSYDDLNCGSVTDDGDDDDSSVPLLCLLNCERAIGSCPDQMKVNHRGRRPGYRAAMDSTRSLCVPHSASHNHQVTRWRACEQVNESFLPYMRSVHDEPEKWSILYHTCLIVWWLDILSPAMNHDHLIVAPLRRLVLLNRRHLSPILMMDFPSLKSPYYHLRNVHATV